MDRKALVYSGVLLLSLVIVSVLLSRGSVQAVINPGDIEFSTTPTTTTLGDPRTFRATTTFADLETATISGVELIIVNDTTGSTTLDVLLPLTSTASTTLDLTDTTIAFGNSTGTVIAIVAFNNVIAFETSSLPGSTLSGGGKFKGILTGATIGFTVDWTSPNSSEFVGDYTATLKVYYRTASVSDGVHEKSVAFAIESGAVDISLVTGFNLIGIPVALATTTTSRDLAELILGIPGATDDQIKAGFVISVLGWNVGSQVYDSWSASVPSSGIFPLKEGQGYFVRVSQAATLTFTGAAIASPIPLDLSTGFNLLSLPVVTPGGGYTSRTLAEAIIGIPGATDDQVKAGSVISVLGWNTGSQVYDS